MRQARYRLHILLMLMTAILMMSGCTAMSPTSDPDLQSRKWIVHQVIHGESLASIAEQVYGRPSQAWIIADFNDISEAEPGQNLLIPLRPYQKGGLRPDGYQTVPILTYHKFSLTRSDPMTVLKTDFEQQMAFLKRNGYRVISLKTFYRFLDYEIQIPEKSVVITIDDGWRSTYDIAFPILRTYGYPATLFLYTDLVTGSSITLDWEKLREMHAQGLDIQCHTETHRDLNMIRNGETFPDYFLALQNELEHSTQTIRHHLKINPRYLAYPYGETNNLVIAMLRSMDYRGGLTVERGSNPFDVNRYRVRRSMIYGTHDLSDFKDNLRTFQPFGSSAR